jgi:hypothetical protein
MGALTDFVANAITYDKSDQSAGIGRAVKRYFDELAKVQGDPAYPSGYAVTNEVQSMATATQTAGNMTLSFTLASGETFTTASILFSAVAATIESAIDSAATTASVVGWTNGDITVSGGAVDANPVVFTFDGVSVAGQNHADIVLADVDGTGGAWGAVTVTTNGQENRSAWAVMNMINVVSGTIPIQGTILPLTVDGQQGSMHLNPNADVLRALALQASIDDGSDAVETAILDGLRANGVAV